MSQTQLRNTTIILDGESSDRLKYLTEFLTLTPGKVVGLLMHESLRRAWSPQQETMERFLRTEMEDSRRVQMWLSEEVRSLMTKICPKKGEMSATLRMVLYEAQEHKWRLPLFREET